MSTAPQSPLRQAFRALSHRAFRVFFIGQGFSLVGTWMQQVAMSWLVYRLTGSAFVLGLVGFTSQIPAFFAAPVAGVLADRLSKLRMVIATQVVAMLQASVLAVLVLTGAVEVWHILLLSGVMGIVSGFDIPARQALLVDLVEGPEDLANAIALNSSLFNGARLVGPAIAGLLIGWVGEGPVFVINAVSFVAVLAALFALGVPPRAGRGAAPPLLGHLREGVAYAMGFAPIRTILTLLAINSLVALPYVVLLPVFATEVLGGGAHTLGFLMSATGLGALAGALYLASRTTVRGLGKVIVFANVLMGAALVALAFVQVVWLAVAVLLFAGFGMMVATASSNTILQTIVEPDKRGRVMSLYTMAFMGMAPMGALIAGAVAERIGTPETVLVGGCAAIAAGLWFRGRRPALARMVRPIYLRLGIIPEVAEGLREAVELRPRG